MLDLDPDYDITASIFTVKPSGVRSYRCKKIFIKQMHDCCTFPIFVKKFNRHKVETDRNEASVRRDIYVPLPRFFYFTNYLNIK